MSSRESKLHTRPRSFAYSRRSFGTPGVRSGIYVLKRMPGLEYCRPSWKNTETVLRVLPGWDTPDNPNEFDSFRIPVELGEFGTWQCCYEAVRKFGEPGATFLLHNGNDVHYNSYSMNPCWILWRAVRDACSKGQGKPEWFPLITKTGNRSPALSPPTELVLVQAFVYRYDSKTLFGDGKPPFGAGPNDPTVIFELSKSAADAVMSAFKQRKDGWNGDEDDVSGYMFGDPVALDDGAFVHIYEQGTELNAEKPASSVASIYSAKPNAQSKKQTGFGYACHLTKTLDGKPGDIPATLSECEDIVRRKVKYWDDILEFMTDEQQAHLINPLFPPSAILYAFRDHKEWILEETRGAAVNRKVVDMHNPNALAAEAAWTPTPPTTPNTQAILSRAAYGDPEANDALQAAGLSDAVEDAAVPQGSVDDNGGSFSNPSIDEAAKRALELARERAQRRGRVATT